MKSWDTLHSTCNMVVDIARYRKPDEVHMMPVCCYYNLRRCLEHLWNHKSPGGVEQSSNIKCLLDSESRYRRRWCFDLS